MSKEALRRIEKCKKTKTTVLDLRNCGIVGSLPKELAELTWLKELNLGSNNISNPSTYSSLNDCHPLAPLAELRELQTLSLYNTQVADISSLAGLVRLQTLSLIDTQVADITPLAGLLMLQKLWLNNTRVADVAPLEGLQALNMLWLSHTQVANITPLAGLVALHKLWLNGTHVADITPLAALVALQTLELSNTHVADIAPLAKLIEKGILIKLKGHGTLNGIFLNGCPLRNPPLEIATQGREAVLRYWEELEEQGEDHLYEAKVLLVGDGGAGKTSLMRRLYQPEKELPPKSDSTRGIDIHVHQYPLPNGRTMRLNVWDFGGQEIYHATHQFFLTKRSLYILLDNTRNTNCISVQDPGFKFWLEVIDLLSDHSPVVIFQNEEGGTSKKIALDSIKGRFSNVKECRSGNLEHPGEEAGIRAEIEFQASKLPHVREKYPAKWVKIREEIERIAKEKAFISRQDYFDIYASHLPFDRVRALSLSETFHELGVLLHYQHEPKLEHLVILQNEWATDAVFKIVDYPSVKGRNGRFTHEDCKAVWSEDKYIECHNELLALMIKFELCYELDDCKPTTWLVPGLLEVSRPTLFEGWADSQDLTLRYQYDFMPKGLVNRLMVRMNRHVPDPSKSWRNGAYFEKEDAQLLVEIAPKGNEIVLRAKGTHRRDLLIIIADELEALHESFPHLPEKVKKSVQCTCDRCKELLEPALYEFARLRKRLQDNKLTVECPDSYAEVSVLELLEGVSYAPPVPSKMEGKLDHIIETMDRMEKKVDLIADCTALLPDVMKKLRGIKEFQSTVFNDLQAIGHRLEKAVSEQHEESIRLVAEMDASLRTALEEMNEAQRQEYDRLTAQITPAEGGVLSRIKGNLPLIPLAYAILSGGDPDALVLLGAALGNSLSYESKISEASSRLVKTWDRIKLWAAGKILGN